MFLNLINFYNIYIYKYFHIFLYVWSLKRLFHTCLHNFGTLLDRQVETLHFRVRSQRRTCPSYVQQRLRRVRIALAGRDHITPRTERALHRRYRKQSRTGSREGRHVFGLHRAQEQTTREWHRQIL